MVCREDHGHVRVPLCEAHLVRGRARGRVEIRVGVRVGVGVRVRVRGWG